MKKALGLYHAAFPANCRWCCPSVFSSSWPLMCSWAFYCRARSGQGSRVSTSKAEVAGSFTHKKRRWKQWLPVRIGGEQLDQADGENTLGSRSGVSVGERQESDGVCGLCGAGVKPEQWCLKKKKKSRSWSTSYNCTGRKVWVRNTASLQACWPTWWCTCLVCVRPWCFPLEVSPWKEEGEKEA